MIGGATMERAHTCGHEDKRLTAGADDQKTNESFALDLKDDINFVEPTSIRHFNESVEAPKNHILWMPDTDRLFQWKEKGKLKGKLAEMMEDMVEDDNPILIIYKFH